MTLSGAILAGGRAKRMAGRPKGLLRKDGEPLAARVARVLESVCDPVFLVGDPFGPYADLGWPVVPDVKHRKGAPGGVHAALAHADPGWVFVAACDMPNLDEATVVQLAGVRGGHDVALYRLNNRVQPLAAWWHTRAASTIGALLPENPGFRTILDALDVVVVDAVDGGPFLNVNTLEEADALGLEYKAVSRAGQTPPAPERSW
jgi:molybdopterin-guanine dinucleotide biosynthesis protein A